MTTVHERNFDRLRELVRHLSSASAPIRRDDLLQHVARVVPPTDHDVGTVPSGQVRWVNDLLWQTTNLVKAGWVTKDGRGTWGITEAGRLALRNFPAPAEFAREAERLFRDWNRERQAQRRAWLVRGSSVLGVNLVSQWLSEGFCSLAASQLSQINPEATPQEIEATARADYDHLKYQQLKDKVDEILAFTTKIRPGDLVIATSDANVYLGDVTGDWEQVESEGDRSNLRRPVEWRNSDAPVDFSDLPAPLPARLASGSTIVDLTADLASVEALLDVEPQPATEPTDAGHEVPRPRHTHLAQPSEGLARKLFVGQDWLDEVRELLDERRQLILYGPPGTGKTFIARQLAADLVGPEQVKLVQFHPAYTYEDFFEGYRPAPSKGDGTISFELRAGPLRQLVNRAREHPDQAFVLIIDEINRANLAKVFGELYFLLEYRDQAIDLLYSSDDEAAFTLPANLYLIGTMNTADRSIALVDAAMRRRFAFVALDPASEPTKSLLAEWSAHHGLDHTGAELLAELNTRLGDPDFLIGPSYFMGRTEADAFSLPRLHRIWRTAILPLLQDHFYGEWERVADRFALEDLLRTVGVSPEHAPADEGGKSDGIAD